DNWQDDFTPLVPQLDLLFGAYFKLWHDKDEIIHNAILLFMETFARKWSKGETLRLSTNYTVRAIRAGLRFMRRGNGGRHAVRSVAAYSNRGQQIARIRARIARLEAWSDYRLLLEKLPERERTAVRMAVSDYTVNEIVRAIRADRRTVHRI